MIFFLIHKVYNFHRRHYGKTGFFFFFSTVYHRYLMPASGHFIGKIRKHFIHSAMMSNKLRNPPN